MKSLVPRMVVLGSSVEPSRGRAWSKVLRSLGDIAGGGVAHQPFSFSPILAEDVAARPSTCSHHRHPLHVSLMLNQYKHIALEHSKS